jgi:hypothetical protein
MKNLLIAVFIVFFAFGFYGMVGATTFQDGGDRLVVLQQDDGGWDWPLFDNDYTDASPANTAAPIGMGLLSSYQLTNDNTHLNSAIAAGNFIIDNSPPHSTGNGIFMHELSEITGDMQYANDVKSEYYDALATGNYVRNTISYDTATWAQQIITARTDQSIGNLATWDLGLAAVGAYRLGAETEDWVSAIEDSINLMDSNSYYDVLGLAGGVWALSEIGEDFDPTSGAYSECSSLSDLAALLASYQIAGGGFAWNSNYVIPNDGNEAIQETAYSILALNAYDRSAYLNEIQGAAAFLRDLQLATGGWENYSGSGENNEVTGEALWGVNTAVPEPTSMLLLGAGMIGLAGLGRKRFFRKN